MVFSKKLLSMILIVIFIGVAAYFFVIKKSPESSEKIASVGQEFQEETVADSPLPVKVDTVKRGDLIMLLRSPGEAVTNMKVTMHAEVAGTINEINVRESQHVKSGEVLVELDDRKYQWELERSEADRLRVLSELLLDRQFSTDENTDNSKNSKVLSDARQAFEKAEDLFQKGLLSRDELDKASRDYEFALIQSGEKKEEVRDAAKNLTQTEVSVKNARFNLDKTKIKAPFPGIITDIKVSPHENVSAGQEIFTLVNISNIRIKAKVLESEVGRIKVGREARLKFSAYPGETFTGKVSAISPVVNPEEKTCSVLIDMANPEEKIKPGMHAEVEIIAEIYKDRLMVPQDAILDRGGRKLVFAVEEGWAKWKYVTLGLENEDYAEILEGITEGEQVIVDGHYTLAHDARVQITN
jgi:multidrug efflux pump subunit AcrA (membrane-fusion protein)